MVNFLCIGDPHFKIDNIQEVELFIERLENLIIQTKPDFIVCMGDVLDTHERLHTIPLNKAYDFIDMMRKYTFTYVLVGNHDMISEQQFLTDNHWMNGMKKWDNVHIVDRPIIHYIDQEKTCFVPYVSAGRFEEALNTIGESWDDASLIFAHQEFFGCKMGAIVSTQGDNWPIDYPQVISGHIHSKQIPQSNIYYTGSAMQHAFGESEKNIILKCELIRDMSYSLMIDFTEFDLKLPRKKTIYLNINEIDLLDQKMSKLNPEDKVRVSLTGDNDKFKAFKKTKKYKTLIANKVKVAFKRDNPIETKFESGYERMSDQISFLEILDNQVKSKKDPYIISVYDKIVMNTETDPNDILLL
jgi:DNA repair exonuclease SbcCD nuclease subunit